MEHSRQYSRIFVTLEEDRADYSLGAKGAAGRCIIEIRSGKGKIYLYVQGLKPEILYKAYIISGGDKVSYGLPIGSVSVDSKGKAELRYEFEPENVAGYGFEIEKFNTVAVLVQKESEIITPLVGFSGQPVMWKNNFMDCTKADKHDEEAKYTNEDITEDVKGTEHIEECVVGEKSEEVTITEQDNESEKEEADCETTAVQEEKEIIRQRSLEDEETQKDIVPPDIDKAEKKYNYHETFRFMATKFKKDLDELNYYKNLTKEDTLKAFAAEKGKKFDDLEYMFVYNTQMMPFNDHPKKIKWIRIRLDELSVLSGNMYKYIYVSFVNAAYKKYKHLILGKYEENNKDNYILGIPGIYDSGYSIQASSQGFRQFKHCSDKNGLNEEYGYWLMYL